MTSEPTSEPNEGAEEEAPTIPTVDLSDLASPDRGVREGAAALILGAFGTYGLIYVKNHGVDFELRDRLFDRFYEFTERSTEAKEPLNRPEIWFQRGWTPPNTEVAVAGGGQPDFKECYFAAPLPTDPECRIGYPEIYAENIWPEDLPGFEEDYLLLGQQLHEAGLSLLLGCAQALGMPRRTFEERLEGGAHVTRLLRYLPLGEDQVGKGVLWGEEHTDFNLLTVLAGGRFHDPGGAPCPRPDEGSGLSLRTRPDEEHPEGLKLRGRAPEGCIVAQVGQQLEILTGGAFLATPHVITPPKTPGYSRLAGAHFLHLHAHQPVYPMRRFRSEKALRDYNPPVLAGTYGIKTLVDIGLAPDSALDHLGYRHYGRLEEIRRREGAGS